MLDGYSSSSVASSVGIERSRLDQWISRGYVNVAESSQGKPRAFSFGEVVQVACIKEMVDFGFDAGIAAKLMALQRHGRHESGAVLLSIDISAVEHRLSRALLLEEADDLSFAAENKQDG